MPAVSHRVGRVVSDAGLSGVLDAVAAFSCRVIFYFERTGRTLKVPLQKISGIIVLCGHWRACAGSVQWCCAGDIAITIGPRAFVLGQLVGIPPDGKDTEH